MKTNQNLSSRDLLNDGRAGYSWPIVVSFIGHLVFLLLFVISPSLRIERPPARSVINVSMVTLKKPAPAAAKKAAATEKKPKVSKPKVVKKAKEPAPKPKAAKVVKKSKEPAKKRGLKSTQAVKKAIQQMEQQVADRQAAVQPEPLKSALDRLRQQVKEAETSRSQEQKVTGGKPGAFSEDGKKTADLIDLYQVEVAFQIQKNWAFNEQMAGGDRSLMAAIVFKVMPDGEIRDIFFTDRSGNTYLDESAYKAIVKSNPVDGHPPGLSRPYVVMAIRFTPQGIR